jgi:hypothetical protein
LRVIFPCPVVENGDDVKIRRVVGWRRHFERAPGIAVAAGVKEDG